MQIASFCVQKTMKKATDFQRVSAVNLTNRWTLRAEPYNIFREKCCGLIEVYGFLLLSPKH